LIKGLAGTSGESSSFKYGFFNRTINSIEIALASGEVVTASGRENADLFHGSLGITNMIELQLEEAKKHIPLCSKLSAWRRSLLYQAEIKGAPTSCI
jgi:delta24-sterol reductase